MEAAAIFMAWSGNSGDAVSKAEYVDRTLRDISDVAMPRRGLSRRPFTYWWNQEIAELRRNCNVRRRRLTRARARRGTLPTEIQGLWSDLREARHRKTILRKTINRSKAKLWGELVEDLDRDYWRTPYRTVLKKLHSGGASIVEVKDHSP